MSTASLPPEPFRPLAGEPMAWVLVDLSRRGRFARELVTYDGRELTRYSAEGGAAQVELRAPAERPALSERRGHVALVLSDGQELARATIARLPELAAFCDAVGRHRDGGERPAAPAARAATCPRCGGALSGPRCPACRGPWRTARRLAGELAPHAAPLAASAALMLAGTAAGLAPPLLVKTLVDSVLRPGAHFRSLAGVIGAMGVVMGATHLLAYARRRVDSQLKGLLAHRLRAQAVEAAARLSLVELARGGPSALAQVVVGDAAEVANVVLSGLFTGLFHALMVGGIIAAFVWMSPWLALAALAPAPAVALIVRGLAREGQLLVTRGWTEQMMLSRATLALFEGFRVVKASGAEERLAAGIVRQSESTRGWDEVIDLHYGHFQPVLSLITGGGSLLIWGYGGYLVLSGATSVGSLVAFVSYLAMLYAHLQALFGVATALPKSWSSCERYLDLLDQVPEVAPPARPVRPARVAGAIRLEDVCFSYVPGRQVLTDVTLAIEPGEMVGLVGRSGSGKTTLVNLIARFFDPARGRVTLDGVPLTDLDPAVLRRAIALVLQVPHLFEGTILENLRLGRPEATFREVCEAADRAQAHRFIVALPDAYDTRLAEAAGLSAGEQQRLTIARALVADPRVLILDEATAALDAQTEAAVQQALAELTRGRTTIAIAHRLTTLARADRLVVLDAGRVADSGTHAELAERPGVYRDLIRAQSEMLRALAMRGGDRA